MTVPDLGPERPGHASVTREMVERKRAELDEPVSGRAFWLALGVIAVLIAGYAVLLQLR
ncbi:MAG: hypothetical protein ACTHU0_34675 [Kofleriaceae bacterium]